ncbi:MAG TPA: NAD(P)-dependent oxidoreductase [Acetobacteraceae bacterium]|nr:NAD(P)-dependent oxidoreductase [Acetobacteraceae bacterium]
MNSVPDSQGARVGVVGLGHMGRAFAENLLADGLSLTVFDRKRDLIPPLAEMGAVAATGLAAIGECEIVLTSLPDDDAVASVTDALIPRLGARAVHVSTSTISAGLARRLAAQHREHGQGYVALPVLGSPDFARRRGLYLLAAGASADIARVRPVVEKLGRQLFVIGEDPGLANVMKLAGNVLTAATLQSMGEVFALLHKSGIDPETSYEVLTSTLFDGKVHKSYGGKIVHGQFSPAGLSVPLAAKDLRLALAEAELARVPMPVAAIVRDRLVAAEARAWSGLDWSALGKLASAEAGFAE